ncbi:nucleoside-diphosphate-sugar epimerase [Pseudorhizobium tarimense]|uniref:Nucleoside-diphosphate-sugar epimerase n=1 Tax=Pseudorhizobium tarimense TaxID=1079109 RepID=A0ABV2H7V5_9HYPH|nr:NAD(P)-dependent oxidoreductase [Pseudorhizobium tarimense]MCJ8519598.1 NAD(P)-dependent oxidoreductase [Pseudorhizobium tarimense]
MRVLVAGGSGLVGRYIVNGLLEAGYDVTVGGRTPPPEGWFVGQARFVPLTLDPTAAQAHAFDGADAFVHAALDHLPGKYRGGEGADPGRFRSLNVDGTIRVFEKAKAAGVRRCIFLSSRAVYDGLADGLPLIETADLAPNSLYGQAKLEAEAALARLSAPNFRTASLRLTGVYGDLRPNKWDPLFLDYLAGNPIPSRAGTEVHGGDVAAVVRLMLQNDEAQGSFNVSDVVTDTATILAPLKALSRCPHPLPRQADTGAVREMITSAIHVLGWVPGGEALLLRSLERLAIAYQLP